MIEPRHVRKRATQLYADIKKRSAPKLWKSGRLAGRVRWEGVPVNYSSDEFATWLLTTIGCNAFLCPYCSAPLDVLSMVLDHDFPLHSGGSNEFSNLVPCCRDCNTIKGRMTGKEYICFRALIAELPPAAGADVLQRLRSGAMGLRLSRQMRASKGKTQLTLNENPF